MSDYAYQAECEMWDAIVVNEPAGHPERDEVDAPYTITSTHESNDEGSDFATVTITFADGRVEVERFPSYFDDPCESAYLQAASFVAAFEETESTTLEERLGPYGLEWEREQLERHG